MSAPSDAQTVADAVALTTGAAVDLTGQAAAGSRYRRRVLQSFAWVGGAQLAGQVINWLSTLVVIRLLHPTDYGLMAMANVFVGFFSVLGDLGVGAAVIQAPTITPAQVRRLFGIILVTNAAGCAVMLATAPLFAAFFGEPRVVHVMRLLVINFLLVAVYLLPQARLMRDLDFRLKARVDVAATGVAAATALVLAWHGFGVWALAFGTVALHAVRAVGFNLLRPTLVVPAFSFDSVRRMAGFGLSVTLDRLLFFLYGQVDIVIAGRVLGGKALGLYAVALSVATIPMEKLMPVITQVAFAAFSRIQADADRVRRNLLRSLRLVGLVGFPASLGLAAVSPDLVPIVLGPKWHDLVLPLQLLSLVLPFKMLAALLPPALFGVGRPRVNVWNSAITVACMAAAMLVGVRFGVMGLCLAWVIAFPVVFAAITRRALTALAVPVPEFTACVALPAKAAAVMALALVILRHTLFASVPAVPSLVGLVAVGTLIYGGCVAMFGRESVRDLVTAIRR